MADLSQKKDNILPNNDKAEHFMQIKSKIDNGSYFKDALDWYFFRYLSPICDRTLLLVSTIILVIVIHLLLEMIKNTYPLTEEFPIFYESLDQSIYSPKLVQLKTAKISNDLNEDDRKLNVDESVAKYLISKYIKEREEFNFKEAEISTVNNKFRKIKSLSTLQEYKKFQAFMNKDNPLSPLIFFGKNVERKVEIESFKYIRKVPKNFAQKAKEYIAASMPNKAEVKFSTQTIKFNVENGEIIKKKEMFVVRIGFFFAAIDKNNKGDLEFIVNDYQLYRVK